MLVKAIYVIGERPSHLPEGVAMQAPRPLYGAEHELDARWGWAGQVIVEPADLGAIARNRDLDAAVVLWVSEAEVAQLERDRLTGEYPEMAAEVAALAEGDLIRSFMASSVPVFVEFPDPEPSDR